MGVCVVRRVWSRWYGKLLVLGLVVVAVLVVAAFAAARYTEDDHFCGTACHEMGPYYTTWQESKHSDVDCVRCHIQPGAVEFVKAKTSALREVWVHFTGQVKAPIAVTRHIPNSTCESCHAPGEGVDPIKLGAVSVVDFSHKAHAEVTNCHNCHAQVVHRSGPGKPFIDPKTMAFCLGCHDDKVAAGECELCHEAPHAERGKCVDCHELGSWQTTFEHPTALGKPHHDVVCEKCHTQATAAVIGFPAGCIDCHKNHHHASRSTLCAKCHLPTHFVPSTFDHPKTGCQRCHEPPHPAYGSCLTCHTRSSWASHFSHPIALGGVHASFACSRCHVKGIDSPGVACSSCHGSKHGGLTDCGQCHSMSSFVPSTFNHPAAGEHSAGSFACSACHPGGSFSRVYCSCHGGSPPSGD